MVRPTPAKQVRKPVKTDRKEMDATEEILRTGERVKNKVVRQLDLKTEGAFLSLHSALEDFQKTVRTISTKSLAEHRDVLEGITRNVNAIVEEACSRMKGRANDLVGFIPKTESIEQKIFDDVSRRFKDETSNLAATVLSAAVHDQNFIKSVVKEIKALQVAP